MKSKYIGTIVGLGFATPGLLTMVSVEMMIFMFIPVLSFLPIALPLEDNKLWYSEVKSGRSETGTETSTNYNKVLLNWAKSGIEAMIAERRNSLWESALHESCIKKIIYR